VLLLPLKQDKVEDQSRCQKVVGKALGGRRLYLAFNPSILALADVIPACEFDLEKAVLAAIAAVQRLAGVSSDDSS
jgi:hypothetical protein